VVWQIIQRRIGHDARIELAVVAFGDTLHGGAALRTCDLDPVDLLTIQLRKCVHRFRVEGTFSPFGYGVDDGSRLA
jgi:hypothetical protein